MNHASLFSGIGGFDLAAEWAGWNNVFNCEIDEFCQRVLKYHFPNAMQYSDIKTTDFSQWRGRVDIITGGFPCQPFSQAGKRRGTDDDRHLWPEMLRAIREIAPRWIVGENVFGFTNWSGGMVFHEVISDLENQGYEVQPFIIPACSKNAPHRRDRVWIVANAKQNGSRTGRVQFEEGQQFNERRNAWSESSSCCPNGTPADTDSQGYKGSKLNRINEIKIKERRKGVSGSTTKCNSYGNWSNFPTQSPLRVRDDGFSLRLDGITVSKLRNESIKAAGNAIVPQVAYEIFKAINQYESMQP